MSIAAAALPTPRAVVVPNKWMTTLAVTFGTLMGAIDSSILNVALPHIQAAMGVTVTEITWVSTSYMISMVLVMPLTAWLGTVFGRKNVYQACLVIFTVASVLAGFAGNLVMLLLARLVQGIGAGALQPTEQAILRETFRPEEQGIAMGLYGLAVMVGPAIGPTLGGWITDNYGWRWIFFINLPVGILGSWMVAMYVTEPPYIKARKTAVDVVGIALMAVGLSTLLVVLEQGNVWDWFASPLVWALSLTSASSLLLFVLWELWGTDAPAVDLRILGSGQFATGTGMGGLLGVGLFGSMFLLPLFFEQILGYTAMQAGLALMPRSVVMIMMMPFTGLLYNLLGPKILIGTGFMLAGWSTIWMSRFSTFTGPTEILIPQIISGMGFALIFVSLSTTSLATMAREKMSSATGLYNLVRTLGGSFGTAIFATMLERGIEAQHAVLVGHLTPYNPLYRRMAARMTAGFVARGADPATAAGQAAAALNGLINQQAAVLTYDHIFQVVAICLLLPFPLVFLLKRPKGRGMAAAH